ncbi:MAG: methyltransferase family protein [Saccharofermentanales bacterium]
MQNFLYKYYPIIIFLILGTIKLVVEAWISKRRGKGGQESSQKTSVFFIVSGVLIPVLIVGELLILHHSFPIGLSLILSAVSIFLMVLRVITVIKLGRYYSVNIRIVDDHKLVKEGIYKYFRHPIYLISILDNLFYPLATGAYLSAIIMVLFGTPAILARRKEEETKLLEKFGDEYREYQRNTWF